jgi:hypothetical protein
MSSKKIPDELLDNRFKTPVLKTSVMKKLNPTGGAAPKKETAVVAQEPPKKETAVVAPEPPKRAPKKASSKTQDKA